MDLTQQSNLSLTCPAFNLVSDQIPASNAQEIREYIFSYGEWGLGLELLIDCLLEEDVLLSSAQKSAICQAATALAIERGQGGLKLQPCYRQDPQDRQA